MRDNSFTTAALSMTLAGKESAVPANRFLDELLAGYIDAEIDAMAPAITS